MKKIEDDGFTFDDVLLVPTTSRLVSRKDVDTSVHITDRLKLNIPVVSANMDTVTEAEMAITIARLGGVGIVHRFDKIEEEAAEIHRVKRAQSVVIEKPYAVSAETTLAELKKLIAAKGVASFAVVEGKKLVGIVTSRDYKFETKTSKKVGEVMTKKVITGREGIDIDEARDILAKNKIEKLPLVDARGNLAGMVTAKDIRIAESYEHASKDKRGRLVVGASIGISGDYKDRLKAVADAEADFVVVDVANGYLSRVAETVRYVKKEYGIDVIAGNVATKEGVLALKKAGADCVKIGIGPGSACLTRAVAGVGYPQLSAVLKCSGLGVPIIADGGIRKSADFAKAIAGGADAAMIGNMLAGTDESPGYVVTRSGANYKFYKGMASVHAYAEKDGGLENEADIEDYTPEGMETLVPYKGSAVKIINNLVGGLRSSMTYLNAANISEFQKNATFVKISEATKRESGYTER